MILLVYTNNGLASDYLCALFKQVAYVFERITWSHTRGDFYIPKGRANVFKYSIVVNGAHVWITLKPEATL